MVPKANSKFENLLVKIFSPKQKTNQILSATVEFCLFKKKSMVPLDKRLQWVIRNQVSSGVIQALKPWYIQNPGIYRTIMSPGGSLYIPETTTFFKVLFKLLLLNFSRSFLELKCKSFLINIQKHRLSYHLSFFDESLYNLKFETMSLLIYCAFVPDCIYEFCSWSSREFFTFVFFFTMHTL